MAPGYPCLEFRQPTRRCAPTLRPPNGTKRSPSPSPFPRHLFSVTFPHVLPSSLFPSLSSSSPFPSSPSPLHLFLVSSFLRHPSSLHLFLVHLFSVTLLPFTFPRHLLTVTFPLHLSSSPRGGSPRRGRSIRRGRATAPRRAPPRFLRHLSPSRSPPSLFPSLSPRHRSSSPFPCRHFPFHLLPFSLVLVSLSSYWATAPDGEHIGTIQTRAANMACGDGDRTHPVFHRY
jgi:hypothetical protein